MRDQQNDAKMLQTAASATLGDTLRQMRESRNLTLEQTAQEAGISRSTINRWELNLNQPRLVELQAVFNALKIPATLRESALSLINAPRANAKRRKNLSRVAEKTGIGLPPNGGDLLKAMRLRRGLSLEEAARRVQVTTRTLRRWENLELWPSTESLHQLCFALNAHEQELIALTCGEFSQPPKPFESEVTRDSLEEQHERIKNEINQSRQALIELSLLSLEAQAWSYAARSEAGKVFLGNVYVLHARYYSFLDRPEMKIPAERALALYPDHPSNQFKMVDAQMFLILPLLMSESTNAFKRALSMLRDLLPTTFYVHMEAWAMTLISDCLYHLGALEEAMEAAEKASVLSSLSDFPGEYERRRFGQAKRLLEVGRSSDALGILEEIDTTFPYFKCGLNLLRAEAYWKAGETAEAERALKITLADARHYELSNVIEKAGALKQQMEQDDNLTPAKQASENEPTRLKVLR